MSKVSNLRKKTELGYKNVIKTKQLLQSLLAREDIKIDMAFLQNDLLIKLMNFQNQYTSKVMDIVDNILKDFHTDWWKKRSKNGL